MSGGMYKHIYQGYFLRGLGDRNRFCIASCVAMAGGLLCIYQIYQLGD